MRPRRLSKMPHPPMPRLRRPQSLPTRLLVELRDYLVANGPAGSCLGGDRCN